MDKQHPIFGARAKNLNAYAKKLIDEATGGEELPADGKAHVYSCTQKDGVREYRTGNAVIKTEPTPGVDGDAYTFFMVLRNG